MKSAVRKRVLPSTTLGQIPGREVILESQLFSSNLRGHNSRGGDYEKLKGIFDVYTKSHCDNR